MVLAAFLATGCWSWAGHFAVLVLSRPFCSVAGTLLSLSSCFYGRHCERWWARRKKKGWSAQLCFHVHIWVRSHMGLMWRLRMVQFCGPPALIPWVVCDFYHKMVLAAFLATGCWSWAGHFAVLVLSRPFCSVAGTLLSLSSCFYGRHCERWWARREKKGWSAQLCFHVHIWVRSHMIMLTDSDYHSDYSDYDCELWLWLYMPMILIMVQGSYSLYSNDADGFLKWY